jgi:hypothetical protein
MTDYSLSAARSLAEKLSENLPPSDTDTPKSKNSGISAISDLSDAQKAALAPRDDDELEEGEIREGDQAEDENDGQAEEENEEEKDTSDSEADSEAEAEAEGEAEAEVNNAEQRSEEDVIPQFAVSNSRSLIITNQSNESLHMSVFREDGERKMYIYADKPFTLPLTAFRDYVNEVVEDQTEEAEQRRRQEFDDIMTVSLLLGALFGLSLFLWFYYLAIGLRVV